MMTKVMIATNLKTHPHYRKQNNQRRQQRRWSEVVQLPRSGTILMIHHQMMNHIAMMLMLMIDGINNKANDVLSIEDDSDDYGDCTPIHFSQSSEHDKKLLNTNKKIESLQGRTTECTVGTGKSKKKLLWTVTTDHEPENPVQPHTSAYLGIRKQEIINDLKNSYPLLV
jgi:hypothetical protein